MPFSNVSLSIPVIFSPHRTFLFFANNPATFQISAPYGISLMPMLTIFPCTSWLSQRHGSNQRKMPPLLPPTTRPPILGSSTGLLISNKWKYTQLYHQSHTIFLSTMHAILVTAAVKIYAVVIYCPPGQMADFLD